MVPVPVTLDAFLQELQKKFPAELSKGIHSGHRRRNPSGTPEGISRKTFEDILDETPRGIPSGSAVRIHSENLKKKQYITNPRETYKGTHREVPNGTARKIP